MAARENQGYLIAVIILVLLTLILALAAFLGLSKASENASSKLQFEEDLKYNKKLVEAYEGQANILKALAGDFEGDVDDVKTIQDRLNGLPRNMESSQQTALQEIADEAKAIYEAYEKDMAGVSTEDGLKVPWRQRIRDLTQLVAKKNDLYNVQVRQSEATEADAKLTIAEKDKAMVAMQGSMTKLQESLAETEKRSLEKEAELKDSLDKAVASNETVNKAFAAFRQTADEQIRTAQNDIKIVENTNQELKAEINKLTRKDFDRADGRIVKVSAPLRSVVVDLGSNHGLVNNQTFSIYDKTVTNFKEGQHKAMIEITKVFPFRAEARIIDERPTNPILTGDHILTATWDPGYSVPMAVTGRFDLDGDIYDDTQKLIQMINRNGGKVVAWHDDQGNIQGKLDSSVRYLVVGDAPVSGANSENPEVARAIVIAMQQMQQDAEANTVEPIDLQKLLNRMGVRAQPKTLKYDRSFRPRNPNDVDKDE